MTKNVHWLAVVLAVAFLGVACSSSGSTSCTDDSDCKQEEFCGSDGKCHALQAADGSDGGEPDGDQGDDGDSGPKPCEHDYECPVGKVCDLASGDCIDGTTACNYSYNCPLDQYCEVDGGICKDRSELCEPCLRDEQCMDPGLGDMCIVYSDGSFCGQRCGTSGCPPGYDCDLTAGSGTGPNPGQCRSNTASCEGTFVCSQDEDCAANKVCNQATGKCVKKCQDTGCAVGLVCHLTGHCGAACGSDTDCTSFGDNLVCCTAPGVPVSFCDSEGQGLCRPAGCALHVECLLTDGLSFGYCDKRSGECETGCRVAGELGIVSDCKSGYKCECAGVTATCDDFDCCPDPGQPEACKCDPEIQDCSRVSVCDNGVCEKIPCHERGVSIACARNDVCCGYPLDQSYPCPDPVPEGDCYQAPADIWCGTCAAEQEACTTPDPFGHGKPGICLKDSGNDGLYCHVACENSNECPATWQCDHTFLQSCQEVDECDPGTRCEPYLRLYDDQQQVQEVKACFCTTDADCKTDFNGLAGECVDDQICLNPDNPNECTTAKICKYGKACQCGTCCSEIIDG